MKNKLRESSPRNLSSDKNIINSKEFSMIVQRIYDKEFLDTFINILNYSKKEFFENISSRIKNFLSEQYNNELIGNEKLLILINSYDKQYEQKYKTYLEELNQFIEKYKQNKNNGIKDKYITNFRKHCSKTEDYAKHNCNQKNKKGNFVPIYIQTQLKYVFCVECHKVFLSNKFISFCNKCEIEYYSNILDKNENKNLLPATWENYHCKCTINQKINCQNCNCIFYVDCKYNILKCLKCKNYRSPRNMENTCSICNRKYSSEILIYNPLEKDHLYDLLNNAIITKNRARPSKLPCCSNVNISNIKFYHNNSCKGILYLVQFKKNLTIICEKCKQFYYYDKFVWTCPSCGEEFKEEKLDSKISSGSSKNNIEIPKKNYLEDKYSKYMRKKEKSMPNVIALANEKKINNSQRNNNSNSKNDSNYEAYSSKNTDRKNRKEFSVDFKNYENNELKDFSPLKSGRKNVFSNKNEITPMKIINNENNSRLDLALKYVNTRNKPFIDKIEFASDNKTPKVYNINNSKQKYLNNNASQKDSECESNEHIPFLNNNNSVMEYKINSDKFFGRQMLQDVKSDSTNDTYRHIIKKNDKDKYKVNNYLIINRDVKFNFFMNQINKMTDEKEKNYENIYNNYTNNSKKNIKNNYNNNTNSSKNNINAKNNYNNNTNNNKNSSGTNSNSNIKKEVIIKNESSKILPHRKNMNEMRDSNISNGYNKKDLHLSEIKNNGQQNQSLTKDENPFDKYTSPKYKMRNIIVNNNNNNDKYKDNQNLIKKMEDNNKIKVNKRCLDRDRDKGKEKIKSSSREKVIILKDERPKKINYSPKVRKNEHMRINLNSKKFDSSSSIKKIEIDLTENKNEKKNEVNYELKNKFQNYKFYKKKMNESQPQPPSQSQSQNVVEEKEKSHYDEKDERKKLLKDIEEAKKEMEKNKPDDIIEFKDIDFKKDLPIEDPYLLNHPDSLAKMQKDLKRIIFKCHLPLFDPNCYHIEKKIGEGTYGAIFQVMNLKTKKKYAMKKIITNNLLSLKFLKSEFEITYENIHPHILNIYGINLKCFDSNTFSLCVLMDLAETDWDLSINERYKTHKNYTEQELISILKQLTSALIYLQKEKKIAHRDIKPENVLIFKNNIYKLADFGEAKAAKANNKINTLRGTDIYMSPLLYNGLKSSKEDVQHNLYKSDVFSLGYTLLYAITFHYDLLNELRDLNDYDKIKNILYERLKPRFSDNFIELILRMINPDEKSRIDFIGLDKLIKELL